MAVEYDISWSDANERLYDIEIRFVAPCDRPRLILPSWRPGRYLIQNFAMNIREWSASAPVSKDGLASWRIEARQGDRVTMRYRCYAAVLDGGSSFLDPEEAYFNGSNLFMMVDGLRGEAVTLAVHTPQSWRVETQLPLVSTHDDATDAIHRFEGRDYDHLIDSPAVAAKVMTHQSFEESGTTIHLLFRGDEGIDTSQFVEPTRAMVRAQTALFGSLPTSEYRFVIHISDRWHGVEHEDSCSILAARDALLGCKPGDDGWDHLLSIMSHELFHLWNVKRIVPAVFVPYDYSVETPTRLLWAMEGVTSYFGDLMLERAGVFEEQKYLDRLAKQIATIESSPAARHLSLAQASFDGWLFDPVRPYDKGNAWYSFYNKGEVVAAMLDLMLRSRAGKSLDDVMRYLWAEYGETQRGLEEDGWERAVRIVAGDAFDEFFERYVHGIELLPYEELFAAAGVAFEAKPRPASLGAKLRDADGALTIETVVRGGPAMAAGLLPGDEVIAVAGTRTRSSADIEQAIRAAASEGSVEIVSARAGVLRRHTAAVRGDGSVDVELRIVEPANALRGDWLRRIE